MKPGDAVFLSSPTWLRDDPKRGGAIEKYPQGTILIILEEDDPELYHRKVLAPDGKIGWMFKDVLRMKV